MSRVKYGFRTVSKENYRAFCLKYPEINISYKDWSEVQYEFMNQYKEYLLETGDIGKLPWGFGYFAINKKKRKRYKNYLINGKDIINLSVDWKASKEEGKKVYNFNFHTDGYTYWWKWYKTTSYLGLITSIYFKPSRDTSRKLAKYLNKPGAEYFQIYRDSQKQTFITLNHE